MLELSLRDRDRIVVLRQVEERGLRPIEGARKLGLSARQFRRLRRRFEADGDQAVIHRARGKRSNRSLSIELRTRALAFASQPLFRDFAPTLLAEHMRRFDPALEAVTPFTLRHWLVEAGLWEVTPRRLHHRKRRERRAQTGELVQMDTSIHPWLEDRTREPIVLIAMMDDATSELFARFAPTDSGDANRRLVLDYILRFGRMRSLYTDRASHFHVTGHSKRRKELDLAPRQSQLGAALKALDIEMIQARSPQAKGRIERLFGTLQDRLVKELRIARVSSLAAANAYLEDSFLPFWNRTFSVKPANPVDAHRDVPNGVDLQRLFAETETRRIAQDFTIRYCNSYYQISKHEADAHMPGSKLTVERCLDGTTLFSWRGRLLRLSADTRTDPDRPTLLRSAQPTRKPFRPPPNHPWRSTNMICSVKD